MTPAALRHLSKTDPTMRALIRRIGPCTMRIRRRWFLRRDPGGIRVPFNAGTASSAARGGLEVSGKCRMVKAATKSICFSADAVERTRSEPAVVIGLGHRRRLGGTQRRFLAERRL